MRTLERVLIVATNWLCSLMAITPGRLEEIKRKQRRSQTLTDRPDVFEA